MNGTSAKKVKLKGKERRDALKKERRKVMAARAIVNYAKGKEDPLKDLAIPLSMCNSGLESNLTCKHWNMIDEITRERILKLEEANVREYYEKSDWGWNARKKKEEMEDEDARYLIALSPAGDLLGFSHFRFDIDFDDEVIYVYELQVEESARRHGLGRFMLDVLEKMATHYNMKKTILTVLKNNKISQVFFNKLGYTLDETSPEECADESFCYEILSKHNKSYKPPEA